MKNQLLLHLPSHQCWLSYTACCSNQQHTIDASPHRTCACAIYRMSLSVISFVVSICIIFSCLENLNTRCGEEMALFADAFIPSYHSGRYATPPLTNKYRHKSKIRRWYVHDDKDTQNIADTQSIAAAAAITSEPTEQSITNNPETPKLDLRILLIDNHDSYTYNLYQYISTMASHPVKVIMNDAYESYDSFITSLGTSKVGGSLEQYYDCIILSPGPGQPSHSSDMGIVLDIIRNNSHIPVLGVCLGHQALGYVYGKEVTFSPCGPVHGLMSTVVYNETYNDILKDDESNDDIKCQLFHNLPQKFDVVRYHSLVVDFSSDDNEESDIEPIAWCNSLKEITDSTIHSNDETICMGLRHKVHPHYGVQFHPESIGTGDAGYQILQNFCNFAHQYKLANSYREEVSLSMIHQKEDRGVLSRMVSNSQQLTTNDSSKVNGISSIKNDKTSTYRVLIHKIDIEQHGTQPSPQQVFETIYSSRPNSFWLDSSTGEKIDDSPGEGCPITSNSRFSIMGSNNGPLSKKIEYFGREHDSNRRGLRITLNQVEKKEEVIDIDILSYLSQELVEEGGLVDTVDLVSFGEAGYTLNTINEFNQQDEEAIPFDYRGGYVGYLGYEVRHDTQCWIFEQEGGLGCGTNGYIDDDSTTSSRSTNPNIPTAAFLFVDRSLVYDHQSKDWYIVGVSKNDAEANTVSWIRDMKSTLESMGRNPTKDNVIQASPGEGVVFVPNRSKAQYQKDISRSHEEIRNGESYELCVTNQLEAQLVLPKQSSAKASHESPFELYKLLRKANPAPFSAFMNLYNDEDSSSDISGSVSICCSSPERFLSVKKASPGNLGKDHHKQAMSERQFIVESKPIKGTAARYTGSGNVINEPPELVKRIDSQIAAKLKDSVKDKAENLMIVDLLRNDLGRVCKVGSVHVPKLMHIESYATVHQMVSTVRGTLDGNKVHAVDAIKACFPGGSMTGAPKQRTMEILDEIEQGISRGPYSGCLGYISLNGCMDMNIIIRSAILTPLAAGINGESDTEIWKASIGCGGAITALSNSADEYKEMLLKSRVVRESISEWVAQATTERSQPVRKKSDEVTVG